MKFLKWLFCLPLDFLVACQMKDYDNQRKMKEIHDYYDKELAREIYKLSKNARL